MHHAAAVDDAVVFSMVFFSTNSTSQRPPSMSAGNTIASRILHQPVSSALCFLTVSVKPSPIFRIVGVHLQAHAILERLQLGLCLARALHLVGKALLSRCRPPFPQPPHPSRPRTASSCTSTTPSPPTTNRTSTTSSTSSTTRTDPKSKTRQPDPHPARPLATKKTAHKAARK